MKIQCEHLDLLKPWPTFTMRDGYHAVNVLVRLGAVPIGEVMVRPARTRVVSHRRLRRRIAKKHGVALLKNILREGFTAGPDAMKSVPSDAFTRYTMVGNKADKTREYVEENFLLPEGLPEPFASWVRKAWVARNWPMPPVTIAVCTRDREKILEGCIRHLQTLDYPNFEILIVDNSSDPVPTREIAEKCGVRYVRCLIPGLSRARNTAIEHARTPWVAFTDDDCRPEQNWLKELVRPTQDANCRCVCGLVQPAQLENAAEIAFEIYGGLGRGYAGKCFDRGFLTASKTRPAQTWRIGAGANMLLHKGFTQWIGGFDVDMGPGPHSVGGCGEDTLIYYQVLKTNHNIHYAPRAIVHHFHRSSPKALRKQIFSYAVGHAAYHARVLWQYRDHRSAIQLLWHLPRWFARNLKRGVSGKTKYPLSLIFLEVRGTVRGPIEYAGVKLKRLWRSWFPKKSIAESTVVDYFEFTPTPPKPHKPTPLPPLKPVKESRRYADAHAA